MVDGPAAETWFVQRGLPAVVRSRQTRVGTRIVPAVLFLGVGEALTTAFSFVGSGDELDRLLERAWFQALYTLLLMATVAVPSLTAWFARRRVYRHVEARFAQVLAAGTATAFVVGLPLLNHWSPRHSPLITSILLHLVALGVLIALTALGTGAVVGWALRTAAQQTRGLNQLVARALPLFLLFTMFGFLAAETWQFTSALSRGRMWGVVGLLAVGAAVFLTTTLFDEVRQIAAADRSGVASAQFEGTPFEGADPSAARVPLTWSERGNILLVLVVTQAARTGIFAVLTFAFFVSFGRVALADPVIEAWSTRPLQPGLLFGIQLPVSAQLIQVCLFIAGFAALYFAASTMTDSNYRRSFYDPLADELVVSLAARDIYLGARQPPDRTT